MTESQQPDQTQPEEAGSAESLMQPANLNSDDVRQMGALLAYQTAGYRPGESFPDLSESSEAPRQRFAMLGLYAQAAFLTHLLIRKSKPDEDI